MNKIWLLIILVLMCVSESKSQTEPTKDIADYFYLLMSRNDTLKVEEYIKSGKFPADYEPSNKITPLEAAIWANKLAIVKILVSNGANINSEKASAIDICAERPVHNTETEEQKAIEILEYLLLKGGNPNTPNDALRTASNDFYFIARCLLMAGANMSEEYKGSREKLRFFLNAVQKKDYEVLNKLTFLDDVINECNCGGNAPEAETALTLAVKSNDKNMVAYLLNRGVDKKTPEVDVCYDDFIYGDTPIEIAKKLGYKNITKLLK